jgi:hypothetical protein
LSGADAGQAGTDGTTIQLPVAPAASSPPLPILATVFEGYREIGRHGRIYAAQLLVLTLIIWFLQVAATIAAQMATAGSVIWSVVTSDVVYTGSAVILLVAGGTALFVSCQRAVVLGRRPMVRDVVRLGRNELGVRRSVCRYWLIVHLVPTAVAMTNSLAIADVVTRFQPFPRIAAFAFYTGWVLATAPFTVLSLPIALFEGGPAALARAWHRQGRGNGARLFVAAAVAVMPFVLLRMALHEVQHAWQPSGLSAVAAGFILFPTTYKLVSLILILCMSAVVAVAYLRLSPRVESVYRVFD